MTRTLLVSQNGARRWGIDHDTAPEQTPQGTLYRQALIIEVSDYYADKILLGRRVDMCVSKDGTLHIIDIEGVAD